MNKSTLPSPGNPRSTEHAISLEDVRFAYASKAGSTPVLHGVSLSVESGEWVAIMGASGSGKSTVLLCAAGLLIPHSGRVQLAGLDIAKSSERTLTELRRGEIGFIFQDFNLIPALSAAQNVEMPARFGGKRRSRSEVLEALSRVGMGEKADVAPDELSGGERQRVAIARALVSRPRVVFADEPTGSLDIETGDRVLAELGQLVASGSSLLMVTHDPRVAAQANRVIWLRDGKITGQTVAATAEQISRQLAGLESETQ